MTDLDTIRNRREAITPGRWHWNDSVQLVGKDDKLIIETDNGVYPPEGADAEFLAAAPSDIDALLVHIMILESDLKLERARVEGMHEGIRTLKAELAAVPPARPAKAPAQSDDLAALVAVVRRFRSEFPKFPKTYNPGDDLTSQRITLSAKEVAWLDALIDKAEA
jgi:hypothetical protein